MFDQMKSLPKETPDLFPNLKKIGILDDAMFNGSSDEESFLIWWTKEGFEELIAEMDRYSTAGLADKEVQLKLGRIITDHFYLDEKTKG